MRIATPASQSRPMSLSRRPKEEPAANFSAERMGRGLFCRGNCISERYDAIMGAQSAGALGIPLRGGGNKDRTMLTGTATCRISRQRSAVFAVHSDSRRSAPARLRSSPLFSTAAMCWRSCRPAAANRCATSFRRCSRRPDRRGVAADRADAQPGGAASRLRRRGGCT